MKITKDNLDRVQIGDYPKTLSDADYRNMFKHCTRITTPVVWTMEDEESGESVYIMPRNGLRLS